MWYGRFAALTSSKVFLLLRDNYDFCTDGFSRFLQATDDVLIGIPEMNDFIRDEIRSFLAMVGVVLDKYV